MADNEQSLLRLDVVRHALSIGITSISEINRLTQYVIDGTVPEEDAESPTEERLSALEATVFSAARYRGEPVYQRAAGNY